MNVLIFGSQGVVGKALVDLLVVEKGHTVYGVDKCVETVHPQNDHEQEGSVENIGDVRRAIFDTTPDIIVNLTHSCNVADPDMTELTKINVLGTANILTCAIAKPVLGHRRIPVISCGWATPFPPHSILGASFKGHRSLLSALEGLNLAKTIGLPCVLSTESPSSAYMSILSRIVDVYEESCNHIIEFRDEDFYGTVQPWCTPKQAAEFIVASFNSKPKVIDHFPFDKPINIIIPLLISLGLEDVQILSQYARKKPVNGFFKTRVKSPAPALALDTVQKYIKEHPHG